MKTTLLVPFTFACLFAAACATDRQQTSKEASQPVIITSTEPTAPGEQPLYLHLLAPRLYGKAEIPARKIATARVHLSRRFVTKIAGEPETPLSGRIEPEGGKFVAYDLSGRNGSTKNVFWGEMELEKPVWSKGGLGGSIIFQAAFVLSTNSDCSAFLKMFDPEAVDRIRQ
jgi:hypothetical protein